MTRTSLGANYRKLFAATTISNLGDGVGQIAYPWLASAVTRDPLLVALVVVAQRLPWLVFTLPAGVITDRIDRRRAMVTMNVLRGGLTLVVAVAVLGHRGDLPGPDEVDLVVGTTTGLYLLVLVATLLLGMAEVLADNCGQTFMPALVDADDLERANGRLWAAESVANTFVGPPLGSVLLFAAFSLPFFVDAGSFFAAAALVWLIPGAFRAERLDDAAPKDWRAELAEGVRWLWRHELLRSMAIILGLMNLASMLGDRDAGAVRAGGPRGRTGRCSPCSVSGWRWAASSAGRSPRRSRPASAAAPASRSPSAARPWWRS